MNQYRLLTMWAAVLVGGATTVLADEPGPDRAALTAAVTRAFRDVHDGWSTDEVLVRDDLNAAFLQRCRELLADADASQCNWTLLNLRKAGKLDVPATKRDNARHDDYRAAAEIAARYLYDKHQQTIDRVLCDPEHRREFDQLARSMAPEIAVARLRKAALDLRKARRLKPELVTRVADWGKQILSFPAQELVAKPSLVPSQPGVYLFRDATGYLYIGEAANLRTRLAKHLDQSDRQALAHFLSKQGLEGITVEVHAFDPESKARSLTVRRAYESELIRSRQPRLNIAP
jgi:predicted GIY-YIG superfamily endonuclease